MQATYKTSTSIRIEHAAPSNGTPRSQSDSPTEMEKQKVVNRQDGWMRQCWNRTLSEKLGIPDHYSHVAVLIVRWVKELDYDLKCEEEAEELDKLLRERFNFASKIIELDNRERRPQAQLDKAIADFVYENDGPHQSHLLFIYYTGHGFQKPTVNGEKELVVSGTPREQRSTDHKMHVAHASWNVAETPLERATAATLVILDCCCASTAMKGIADSGRPYFLMAATGKDTTTPKPGPRSYTNALIKSLKKMLKDKQLPFNPYDLNQEIIRHRSWDTSSQVFNRRLDPFSRDMRIAPIQKHMSTETVSQLDARPASYLDLRIAFVGHSSFSPEEITKLASEISILPKNVDMNITEIEWIGFKPAKDSLQFKQIVRAYLMLWAFIIRWKAKRLPRKRRAEEDLAQTLRTPKRTKPPSASYEEAEDVAMKSLSGTPLTPMSQADP